MHYFGSSFIKTNFVLIVFFVYLFSSLSQLPGAWGLAQSFSTQNLVPILMYQKKTFGQSKFIKQRLDEKEITNLNSLKLNIQKIWKELDSDKAFCVEK